jgi:hypothetical protein
LGGSIEALKGCRSSLGSPLLFPINPSVRLKQLSAGVNLGCDIKVIATENFLKTKERKVDWDKDFAPSLQPKI